LTKAIFDELERIRQASSGILLPSDVIRAAKSEESPLHKYFCWNDKIAAHSWRLEQARQLIRACVTREKEDAIQIRAYVSLTLDRKDGGYRPLSEVLRSEDLKLQLLEDARRDMRLFTSKYSKLCELAGVLTAMREVTA
jgi:hypothetical protein